MDIQDDNHPNNGGKYLSGDEVTYAMGEFDSLGWIVASDEDEDGYFEIVDSRDNLVEVHRDEVAFVWRY